MTLIFLFFLSLSASLFAGEYTFKKPNWDTFDLNVRTAISKNNINEAYDLLHWGKNNYVLTCLENNSDMINKKPLIFSCDEGLTQELYVLWNSYVEKLFEVPIPDFKLSLKKVDSTIKKYRESHYHLDLCPLTTIMPMFLIGLAISLELIESII